MNSIYWLVVKTLAKTKPKEVWAYNLLDICTKLPAPQEHQLVEAITFQALKVAGHKEEVLKVLEWVGIPQIASEHLLEKAGCTVSKILLQKTFDETTPYLHYNFLDWLEGQAEKYPKLVFTKYYYIKLCIKNGFSDRARNHIADFLRSKGKDFWAWELAAQTTDDPESRLACLAKAVSLCAKEEMLVNVRFQLANEFSQSGQWSYAAYEITKVIKTRAQKNWLVHQHMIELQDRIQIQTSKMSKPDYKELSAAAENLLFDQAETVMISDVDENHIRFLNDALQYSKIKRTSRSDLKPGDAAMVYYRNSRTNQFLVPVQIRKTDNPLSWVKEIEATIKPTPGGFSFSQGVYFPKSLLDRNAIMKESSVKAKTVWAFDQKKERYGWKAVLIV